MVYLSFAALLMVNALKFRGRKDCFWHHTGNDLICKYDDASFPRNVMECLRQLCECVCVCAYKKTIETTTNIKQHDYHHHSAHLTFVIQMSDKKKMEQVVYNNNILLLCVKYFYSSCYYYYCCVLLIFPSFYNFLFVIHLYTY